MAGDVKTLQFAEGTSVSSPTQSNLLASSLLTYTSDANFVSAKGSAAASGDAYVNTTDNILRIYNGSSWQDVNQLPSYTDDAAFVSSNGAAVQGDMFFSTNSLGGRLFNGSNWEDLGGGSGAAGINYISNSDMEGSVDGYLTYADTAGENAVDGTGGSANITVTRNTTDPLRKTGDLKITKDGANRQGEGVSYDFSIDNTDKSRKLYISFDYNASDANYSDNDIRVQVYDDDADQIVRVNGEDLKGGKGSYLGWFSSHSSSVNYRLIFHISSTNASAYDVFIDNIQIGPREVSYGAYMSDWIEWTPTGSWSSNTTYTGRRRRVGDSIELQYAISLSGAPNSTNLELDLPSGINVDESKLQANFTRGVVHLNSGSAPYLGSAQYNKSTNIIQIRNIDPTGSGDAVQTPSVDESTPFTFGSGSYIHVQVELPVEGWSSNSIISEDLGNREIYVECAGNSGGTVSSSDNATFTEVEDTAGAWDGDEFTATETGLYAFEGMIEITSANLRQVLTYIDTGSGYSSSERVSEEINDDKHKFSGAIKLTKGHKLTFRLNGSSTLNNTTSGHHLRIWKISTPQTIFSDHSKRQTKTLSSPVTTSTDPISSLTFNNLINGKRYVIEADIEFDYYEDSALIGLNWESGTNSGAVISYRDDKGSSGDLVTKRSGNTIRFQADGSTLTFNWSEGSAGAAQLNSGSNITLLEDKTIITTEW